MAEPDLQESTPLPENNPIAPVAPSNIKASIKEEYELIKLKAEIKRLTRPLLMRLEFWQVAIPGLVAIVGLVLLWHNGFFDSQNRYLLARKENLDYQIAANIAHNDSLLRRAKYYDSLANAKEIEAKVAISALNIVNDKLGKKSAFAARLLKAYNECADVRNAINEIKNDANRDIGGTTQAMGTYGPFTAVVSMPDSPATKKRFKIDTSEIDMPQPLVNTTEDLKDAKPKKKQHLKKKLGIED